MQWKTNSSHSQLTAHEPPVICKYLRFGGAAKIGSKRPWPIIFQLLGLIVVMLFPGRALADSPGSEAGPLPLVTVAAVTELDVNPPAEYVSHVEAIQMVDLYAQVVGNIQSVNFEDGQLVKEGDSLFSIEQEPYKARFSAAEAALAQARAGYEGTKADLDAAQSYVEAAEADLDVAKATFERADKYLKRMHSVVDTRSIAQANLDVAESDLLQAKARVTQAKALIRQRESQVLQAKALLDQGKARILQAQADLDVVRINLGYTEIRSPITGRIGKALATKGNYVGPSSGPLARIVQMDPIRVVYSISENDLSAIQKALADSGKDKDRLLAPQLRLANSERFKGTGHVAFVDNQVDPGTGTIAVWAVFDNPGHLLLPGQYVTVLVKASAPKLMSVVPQAAVLEDHDGRYVLVVDDQNRVSMRRVKTGPVVGVNWAVASGLATGEKVIVEGVQKARPGEVVKTVTANEPNGR